MTTGEGPAWEQHPTPNSGSFSAGVRYGDNGQWQDEWLVTPALNTVGLSIVTLEFAESEVYWANYGLYHDIMVSTTVPDDPAAFTSVLAMTPSNHTIDSWSLVNVDLSAYAGLENVYVAFRYRGDWADDWFVDDVHVFEPFQHDVELSELSPSYDIIAVGSTITPQIVVKNVGQNTETFDVNLVLTHNEMVVYDEFLTVTDLEVGASLALDFSTFITLVGNYVLTGTTLLDGDMDPDNDTGAGLVVVWSQERTPMGILYTEWGCGPCVSANVALDEFYPNQGNDASLLRVHVWWPAGTDPMFLDNESQCRYLHGMAPVNVNGVPWLFMDNSTDTYALEFENWLEGVELGYSLSAATPSPLNIDVVYNAESGEAQVILDVIDNLVAGTDFRLFVAITEDGVALEGPNGEPIHNQVFRWLFPGEEGLAINTETGVDVYDVPVTLNPDWNFENLRALAWVQEYPGGPIINSATAFLTEGTVGIDDDYSNDDQVEETDVPTLVTGVVGATPNPFNPMTTVKFSVKYAQHVTLAVYNMNGQKVATLVNGTFPAGEHPVQWNGTDDSGRSVSSGTYLVHMKTVDHVSASKIMLVR